MLRYEQVGRVVIATVLEKRVDARRAPDFKDEMTQLIDAGNNNVVLDLSGVEFVDSSGLGAIVSCLRRIGPRGNLTIVGAHGAVSRLFSLTRMDRVFPLHDSLEKAMVEMNA